MPHQYLKDFINKYKCPRCGQSKLRHNGKEYSVCYKHLAIARNTWNKRAKERRSNGLCLYCDRRLVDNTRCLKCSIYNKRKCIAWARKNKEHMIKYRHELISYYKQFERCWLCPEHRRLAINSNGGYYNKCRTCLDKRY